MTRHEPNGAAAVAPAPPPTPAAGAVFSGHGTLLLLTTGSGIYSDINSAFAFQSRLSVFSLEPEPRSEGLMSFVWYWWWFRDLSQQPRPWGQWLVQRWSTSIQTSKVSNLHDQSIMSDMPGGASL